MVLRTRSAIRPVGATHSTGAVSDGTIPCDADGIVPLAGTESIDRLERGTGDPRETARARMAPTENPTHPRNPMWCHAHGPPSQPAVSPAASPTLVQRISRPNGTRRSAPNATIVPKAAPASPATKPYPIAINAIWTALTGSLGVNTAAAMSAATAPATAPPTALRPPTIATTLFRGEFTAALTSDQVMFLPTLSPTAAAPRQLAGARTATSRSKRFPSRSRWTSRSKRA